MHSCIYCLKFNTTTLKCWFNCEKKDNLKVGLLDLVKKEAKMDFKQKPNGLREKSKVKNVNKNRTTNTIYRETIY